MRLLIRHRTQFRYATSSQYLAQLVRMTPRDGPGQHVLEWRVCDERGRDLPEFQDGFGNVTHLHTLFEPHREVAVDAQGVVETRDTAGVLGTADEALLPAFFTRVTARTAPEPALAALAAEAARGADALEQLHRVLGLVHRRVAYVPGSTHVDTTAEQALLGGAGVCQDHAHIFVAAARLLGHPARYVSGYLYVGGDPDQSLASHAWAEAFVHDLGWVGFDASQGLCPTQCYVRTSVGLDYADAAPVRGIRRGGAGQSMQVALRLTEVSAQ